jgi:hypothetical protein
MCVNPPHVAGSPGSRIIVVIIPPPARRSVKTLRRLFSSATSAEQILGAFRDLIR